MKRLLALAALLTAYVMAPVAGDRPLYAPDRSNVQPRLGAAWSVREGGKTVFFSTEA